MSKPRPCKRCGSTVTVQMEGKLFCSRCNEQIEEYFEIESEDDEGGNVTIFSRLKTPKRLKDIGEEEDADDLAAPEPGWKTTKPKQKTREKKLLDDDDLTVEYLTLLQNMESIKDENVGGSATRIGSFCKIIYKISTMMIVELGFPDTYKETVKCITQMYLQKCGVAFVEREFTEDSDKMFKKTKVVKRSKAEIDRQLKRLKLDKKKKGRNKLEKSVDAWSLLQDATLGEDFALASDEENLDETRANFTQREEVTTVETNIENSIKEKAEACYISLDAIVAVLFVSSMLSGCLWVTLSDIVRWIREDRGRIFGTLPRLNPSGRSVPYNTPRNYLASLVLPLSEFCRVNYWVWQIVDIDTPTLTIPFPQIVARYLYNLNLPTDIMQRVLVLMDCAPPSDKLDKLYITQQGDIHECSLEIDVNRPITSCFGKNVEPTYTNNFDCFISTEAKVLAYILLALKLVYGLDGKNEYKIKQNSFDPVEWIYQLRMRTMIFEGHAVKDVIDETKINYPLFTQINVCDESTPIAFNQGLNVQFNRARMFPTVMPTITPCDSAFDEVNPFIDDITDRVTDRNDEDKVYAPIRAQVLAAKHFMSVNRSEEEQIKITERISGEAYQILTKDYGEHRIRLENANDNISEGSSNRSSKWNKLFPCAKSYMKSPQPEWAQGMIVRYSETNNNCRRINERLENQSMPLVGPRSMFLSAAGAADLYRAASHTLSPVFIEVLELFSKIISEHHHIMYAAFTMLETQIIDRTSYTIISRKILDQETIPLSFIVRTTTGTPPIYGSVIVSVDQPIKELRELRILRFGAPRGWISGICDENNSDSDLEEPSDSKVVPPRDKFNLNLKNPADTYKKMAMPTASNKFGHLYDWTVFWQFLTMRYW